MEQMLSYATLTYYAFGNTNMTPPLKTFYLQDEANENRKRIIIDLKIQERMVGRFS